MCDNATTQYMYLTEPLVVKPNESTNQALFFAIFSDGRLFFKEFWNILSIYSHIIRGGLGGTSSRAFALGVEKWNC